MYCTPSCHSDRHGVGVLDALGDGLDAAACARPRPSASTRCCCCGLAGQALHQRAVDLDEVERRAARAASADRARRRSARARSGSPACAGPRSAPASAARMVAAISSVTWRHRRCGSACVALQLRVEPVEEGAVAHAVARQAHEQQVGLALAANDSDAPTTQRSMFFSRSLRSAAAHELRGQHLLALLDRACAPARRTCLWSSPCRLAIGCCTRRKRFSISAALMCLHPDLVVGLHARVGVGVVGRDDLVAAAVAAAARGIRSRPATTASSCGLRPAPRQPDGAGGRDRLVVDAATWRCTRASNRSAPGLEVVRVAALESARKRTPPKRPATSLGAASPSAGAPTPRPPLRWR